MKAKYVSLLVLIVLLITSCGVSKLKKRYQPEVLKQIEKITLFNDDMPAEYRGRYIELGLIEVHDNPLRSWEYLEFMAKAQAFQRYGDVDIIIRATFDVEKKHPLASSFDMEKYIRGVAVRLDKETKAEYDYNLNEWRKKQIK